MGSTVTNTLTSEFVYSAPSYLRIIATGRLRTVKELRDLSNSIVTKGVESVKTHLNSINYPMELSILFNAFTEKNYLNSIKEADNFSFKNVYSDSGGLQMVTLGLISNPQEKRAVYECQSQTDVAMCFDEIPVRNEKVAGRSNHLDKVFDYSDHKRCAVQTCHNLMEQIDYFEKVGSKTKVLFIVQGNTMNDMIEWFEVATKELSKDYWERVGGIAIGGVCLGNGIKEDIEKMAIYHNLREMFGEEYTKRHLHILGVGATSRLNPLVILRNTGFIPSNTHVSYDSTSLSMAYTYGRFLDSNGEIQRDSPMWESVFKGYYDLISPIFLDFNYTESYLEKLYPVMLSDMLCHKKVYHDHEDDKLRVAHHGITVLMNIFQILNFTKTLYKMYCEWDTGVDSVGMLKYVKTLDDYLHWKSRYSSNLVSKRIARRHQTILTEELGLSSANRERVSLPKISGGRSKASLIDFLE